MDEATRRDINKVAWRTLRDAGEIEPPVRIETILDHLNLYRDYYDLQNPGFIDRAKYKLLVHGRKLVNILHKIKLTAVLFNDERRIIIDRNLPEIKLDHPSFHEVSHRIIPWHRPYFAYGDTAQTLDPDWHEELEAEANYGASAMMFCGQRFTDEARAAPAEWAAVRTLTKRYGKSISTTLRRFVQFGPDLPMAMLVSTPSWMDKPPDQITRARHFVPSERFVGGFSSITPQDLLVEVDAHAVPRRGGLVGDFTCSLTDDNGELHEFHGETFFNTHYLQTLFVHLGKLVSKKILAPRKAKTLVEV